MTDLQQRMFTNAWWRASCAPVPCNCNVRTLAQVMLHYSLLRQRRRPS